MKKIVALMLMSTQFAGCANWSGKANPEIVGANGEKRLIVQSGLFERCGNFDNANVGSESALVAGIAALAVKKVAEMGVEALAGAIDNVAKQRNEAFPITGKSEAWLYKSSSSPSAAQRCLIIVAGAKTVDPKPCSYTGWRKNISNESCDELTITKSMKRWGLDRPAFYAEILLYSPEKSAGNYVTPKLVYSYYPEPLSSHAAKDLKNTIVTVKAANPVGGGAVFTIVYQNGEFRPEKQVSLESTSEVLESADDSGEWLVLPSDLEPSSVGGLGGAVNIETTIIETPEPNKLIAFANDVMKESKPAIADAANAQLSYALLSSARQVQRTTEAKSIEDADSSALTACKELDVSLDSAKISLLNQVQTPIEYKAKLAYKTSCASANAGYRKAKAAWGLSSYRSQLFCFNDNIRSEIAAACP